MKKIYSLAVILISVVAFGQISLTVAGTAVTENFDGMGPTGTTLPGGWSAVRASGTGTQGQALSPIANDGTSNTGAVYNVGTASATDRALGSIASGSTVPAFGAQVVNNMGTAMTGLTISFTEEQWRTGDSSTANEIVAFSYSTDATSLTDGTWTAMTAGDLTEILTSTTTSAAVDGNLAANQLAKSFSITGLSIANGASVWIKWTDANAAGVDCMLAVDNLSLTGQTAALAVSDIKNIKGYFVKNTFVKNDEIIFGSQVKDVKIYNMLGQIVKTASVKENEPLDIAELGKGNYIVTGTLNNEAVSQKILKD